jgi:hypothetical protein
MSRPSERVRADLQARTGVDFTRYADDDFLDAVTGWSVLKGLVVDAGLSVGAGLILAIVALAFVLISAVDGEAAVGVVIGAVVAGIGITAAFFGLRLRRRAPDELGRVFDASAAMTDRVAADIASGELVVSYADAVKGMTLVAAIPALTRAAQRRFPLVGTVTAPVIGAVITRALSRVWPSSAGEAVAGRLEGTTRRLEGALQSARSRTVPKLATAMRWATMPLLVAGTVLVVLGGAITLISAAGG